KELMIMDQGYCAAPILFRIQNGNVDGINLNGRDIVMLFDFPGPTILDGNATSRLYIDDAADEGQRIKNLEAIFQGKRGGPMEMISSLTSKWLPTQSTQIEINEDGNNLTVTVGSFGKMKYGELKNESGRTMTLQGAGFASAFGMDDETFALAPSASQWSDPNLPHQFSTKSGVMANFSWRGS
ncbi:MAG TPA: DUF1326 domain-containing protein, partial [Nitrososphaeraceae archaeon]|nr:DUF1326 domain-containing protein [Nitrososphaeraceae archaeon]